MKKQKEKVVLPKALTKRQAELMLAISQKEMVITTGPAGTGKSYIPAVYSAYYYNLGMIEKIILTRPTVPVGKGIGFLPGTLEEKLQPWVAPFISVLEKSLSKGAVDCMLKNGSIEIVPFDVIRGRTFDNSFIVLDEAQNTTRTEIKAFVTRIGQNSKTIINGDINQSDLKNNEESGLEYLTYLLGDINNKDLSAKVGWVDFDIEDCVRSELCKMWLKAFDVQ